MNAILTYVRESFQELELVRWPTRQQAVRLSVIVLIFTVISSAIFGTLDLGLSALLRLALSFAS